MKDKSALNSDPAASCAPAPGQSLPVSDPGKAAGSLVVNVDEGAPRDDGTTRKAHYGVGRQPWDDIRDVGWGPAFAAGNVLKYLRRTKDLEHSLQSARWYYARLIELTSQSLADTHSDADQTLSELWSLLTDEERRRLM